MKKYQRCMVLAGGGLRFGIYLGMYAAAREAGRAPDLLLATCGGAIAAAIIAALPDDEQRRAWLASPEMYAYWGEIESARRATITGALAQAVQRKLSRGNAPRIPDLFNNYLFEAAPPLPPLPTTPSTEVAIAIVGGKLLFGPQEVGQARGQRKLFVQTVMCEPRAGALLLGMRSPFSDPCWGAHALADEVLADTTMSVKEAVGISTADFYYFPCRRLGAEHYIGGVVDLFPIEVAHRLANEVMMEFKQSFDQTFAIPAWRAVLGIDGNQRVRHVNAQHAHVRFDSSDLSNVLARQQVNKKLDWRHNRIVLVAPPSHATYVQYMEDQWQYGYQRAREALQQGDSGRCDAMRSVNRYNRALSCVF